MLVAKAAADGKIAAPAAAPESAPALKKIAVDPQKVQEDQAEEAAKVEGEKKKAEADAKKVEKAAKEAESKAKKEVEE